MRQHDAATRLLRLLHGTVQGRLDVLPDWIERGVIGADLSLALKHHTFPVGSYRINELFTLPDPIELTTEAAVGDHGGHAHAIPRPAQFRPLAPDTLVVVGVYLNGSEPIVLCRDVGT